MIEITCDRCGKASWFSDGLAGKQWRCPKCGAAITIPASAGPPPAPGAVSPASPFAPPQAIPPGVGAEPSKALAICALVFGCLGFIPILGLAGIILAVVVLAAKKPGKGMAVTGLILGLVLAAGSVTAGMFALSWIRRLGDRTRCMANLQQIGMAANMYAQNHRMCLPKSPKLLDPYLADPGETRKCPAAEEHRDGGYVYHVRPNARLYDIRQPAMAILACDRKGNHDDGRNVVFADGHVEFLTEKRFQRVLSQEPNAEFAKHLRDIEGQ